MRWGSLRLKLVLVYTLLILFAVELIGAYFVRALTTSMIHNQSTTAKSQAQLMATLVSPQLGSGDTRVNNANSITTVLQSIPHFLSGTVYLLNADGDVTYTSGGGALIGQKRTDSVATQALLHKTDKVAILFDPLTQEHLLAVAIPIVSNSKFYGVLEYVLLIQSTYDTIRQVTTIFYTGSGVVLVLTVFLGIILSRALTRPILDVTRQARVMAAGDFSMRVTASSNDEFGDLVQAINHLASELDDALARNRLEQERLRAVITSMGEGVIVLDSDSHILFVNHAAQRMMHGVTSEAAFVESLGLLSLTDEAQEASAGDVTRLVAHENSVFDVSLTKIRRHDSTDGFVAVLRDVTEQERLNQARRDFVSNVSHELRTPLTSIKSYLEAIRDLNEDETRTRDSFMEVIDQETDRMVRLTRDLLQLSGLDRKGQSLLTHSISIKELMNQVLQRFGLQASRQQLALTVDSTDANEHLLGNRDMVGRIMDNLVSNAIKYTPEGGHVHVFAKVWPETIELIVKDDGIGIPEKDLPHVFERFYRVDKGRSRRLGGTGLGLALAREMTLRMGGRIAIQSEPNSGTGVHVHFVRAEGVEDA